MIKRVSLVALLMVLPLLLFAQSMLPPEVKTALDRIERSFRAGDPVAIDDMLVSGMSMRLGDSLYVQISRIQALDLLEQFFADKKSNEVVFAPPEAGYMIYSADGKKDTTRVDIWFSNTVEGLTIQALNISNYPPPVVFYNDQTRRKDQ